MANGRLSATYHRVACWLVSAASSVCDFRCNAIVTIADIMYYKLEKCQNQLAAAVVRTDYYV